MIVTILVFLLILSVLVLIHEAGHFFVAKKLGIKVEEFGFGFPPRLYGKKIGETVYSINWLPIGGFVKLYGEDEAGGGSVKIKHEDAKTKNDPRSFSSRNPWQRALIVVAGVVMNFLLAVIIVTYLFAVRGVPTPGNTVAIAAVAKDSPAAQAGLKAGDTIVKVNGIKVTTSDRLIAEVKMHLGQQVMIVTKNTQGKIQRFMLIPRLHAPANQGALGIALAQSIVIKKYPWYQAPFVGIGDCLQKSWMILEGLGSVVHDIVTTHAVPAGVAGPIGIAQYTGLAISFGVDAVLEFASLLSLNLAIMNILPIPALDGGRLFFILIEAITGRKVNQKFENYAHSVGMAVLLGLIFLITFHDVYRIFTHQPLLPK